VTTFTTLSDTTVAQDKPLTQSVARALRDNPLAIQEGDASAPKVALKAVNIKRFKAQRNSAQTVTGTSATVLSANTVITDPSSNYNASTFRYTPDVAGLFLVGLKVETTNIPAATLVRAEIWKNGALVGYAYENAEAASYPVCPIFTTLVDMNGTTDYIEARVSAPSIGSVATYSVSGEVWAVAVAA
jgi:hypothetical protein